MSQYADGGLLATKPYISSGAYISKMSNYCKNCQYDVKEKVGEKACPFNSLYWNFINKHIELFKDNQRMSMMLAVWNKMDGTEKQMILRQSQKYLQNIEQI
jgi:deoxyribodipyrimidine photolyase-related protein